ncbi:mercuric transport protein MerTP [Pelobium sp.]|nr:mercuric transport protein MerTP [Pelobium sp.]MDA9555694.1 mercuric transport protein MerTP [Pelobium sp.]
MINIKSQNTISGIGFLSAFAASICCIVPVIVLFASSGALLGNFSWIEPARPYLIGVSVIVLSFAWYLKIKSSKQLDPDCNCPEDKNDKFVQSKTFLGVLTVFAILMIFFPSYANIFYKKPITANNISTLNLNTQKINFAIEGMSCTGCEQTINNELLQIKGIINYKTSYENKNSIVTFDPLIVKINAIKEGIDKTGYKVKSYVLVNDKVK